MWTAISALLKEAHTNIFLYSMSKCWSISEDIIHVDMIEKTKMGSCNLQGLRVLITVSQCLTHNDIHSSYKAIVSYKLHTLSFFLLWTNCWNSTWDCKTLLLAWLVNGSKVIQMGLDACCIYVHSKSPAGTSGQWKASDVNSSTSKCLDP